MHLFSDILEVITLLWWNKARKHKCVVYETKFIQPFTFLFRTQLFYYVHCTFLVFYNPFLWRRQWQPIPVLLPGKSYGRRSLVGCNPWGCEESDMTEQLHFHFSLSCIGEGNGNPLQYSCLENPRDRGAWWAAVYGVAQSRTRLKRLSSSSVMMSIYWGSRFSGSPLIHHLRSIWF